jgi:hypothetical protein
MTRTLALLIPLLLLTTGPVQAKKKKSTKKLYTPWVEPQTGIEWRGDQRHPRRLPSIASEEEIFRVDDFRWSFQETAKSWNVDFGQAQVDTSKVTGISLIWYPFFPKRLAGHTSLLFHLAPGGISRIQDGQLTPSDATGIVISLEGRGRRQPRESPRRVQGKGRGLQGHLRLAKALREEPGLQ